MMALEITPIVAENELKKAIEVVVRVKRQLDHPFVPIAEANANIGLQVRSNLVLEMPRGGIRP